MKKLFKCLMLVSVYCAAIILGAYVESNHVHYFSKPVQSGLPKAEIPAVGSAMHIEYVSPDKTEFVAVYAGTRLFYKTPVSPEKTMVRLDSDAAYEVVDQKTKIAGSHGKTLAQIK